MHIRRFVIGTRKVSVEFFKNVQLPNSRWRRERPRSGGGHGMKSTIIESNPKIWYLKTTYDPKGKQF